MQTSEEAKSRTCLPRRCLLTDKVQQVEVVDNHKGRGRPTSTLSIGNLPIASPEHTFLRV